jgi:hypothetical protein
VATSVQIVFDCADPDKLAGFWAEALRCKKQDPPEGFGSWEDFLRAEGIPESQWDSASAIVDPDGTGPRIFFQQVPEKKSVKNRVHLDLNIGGGFGTPPDERRHWVDSEVDRIVRLGARKSRTVAEGGGYFVNMFDPEGNEFDVH